MRSDKRGLVRCVILLSVVGTASAESDAVLAQGMPRRVHDELSLSRLPLPPVRAPFVSGVLATAFAQERSPTPSTTAIRTEAAYSGPLRQTSSAWDNVHTASDDNPINVAKLAAWTTAGVLVGDLAGLALAAGCSDTGGSYCSGGEVAVIITMPVVGAASGALIGGASLVGAVVGSAVGTAVGWGVGTATDSVPLFVLSHAVVTIVIARVGS